MRKVIQMTTEVVPIPCGKAVLLTVLCDDGTMWVKCGSGKWKPITNVPQPEEILE